MNHAIPTHNPFATRWIRPGALGFQFAAGQSLSQLVTSLVANQWWGQIVGPHGSGKSTLLATLLPACQDAGRHIVHFELRDRQRYLPIEDGESSAWHGSTLVVVDGYEQLGFLARRNLQRNCRRQNAGLLVTSHVNRGLPLLLQTASSEPLLQSLVAVLYERQGMQRLVVPEEIAAAFHRHRGNLREALLDLYDLHQRRQQEVPRAAKDLTA